MSSLVNLQHFSLLQQFYGLMYINTAFDRIRAYAMNIPLIVVGTLQ